MVYFSHFKNHGLNKDHCKSYLAYQSPSFLKLLLKIVLDKSNKPAIKIMGKAHLLVVKQYFIRYEESDVVNKERVMKGNFVLASTGF